MKKKYVALICILAALLTACQPSNQGSTDDTGGAGVSPNVQTTAPTETQAPPETTAPTQQTTVPTEETTVPTEPTEDLMAVYDAWQAYIWSPEWENYLVFRFDGELPARPGPKIDTSDMKVNCLCAIDFNTAEVHQITQEDCFVYEYSSEHIYYTLEGEPTKVYRVDHHGENKTLMYESEYGNINQIRYFGTDANGQLILLENNAHIISYDIPTETVDVLMEAYFIEQFYFTPSSLSSSHVVQYISEEEQGATIFWTGLLNKGETGKDELTGYDTFYYFINTGEQWDVSTWEPRT